MTQKTDLKTQLPGLFAPVTLRSWRVLGAVALWVGSRVGALLTAPHGWRAVVFTAHTFPWLSMYLTGLSLLAFGFVVLQLKRDPSKPFLERGLLRPLLSLMLAVWAGSTVAAAVIIWAKWTAFGASGTPTLAAVFGGMAAIIPFATWLTMREKRRKEG